MVRESRTAGPTVNSLPSCGSQSSSIHSLYPTTLGRDRSWQEVLGQLRSLGPDLLPRGSATTTRRLFRCTAKQVNLFKKDYTGAGLPRAYYYFSLTPIFSFTAHIEVKKHHYVKRHCAQDNCPRVAGLLQK